MHRGNTSFGVWYLHKAPVVPQCLCGNLRTALKFQANPQEDGDGSRQSMVTNLCEGSRKGLTEALRNFVQVDHHRALEVGYLREGLGSFKEGRKEKKGSQRCVSGNAPKN